MLTDQQLAKIRDLLVRVGADSGSVKAVSDPDALCLVLDIVSDFMGDREIRAPDSTWWHDFYEITGGHMVCTEDGWTSPLDMDVDEEVILDEVNAPPGKAPLRTR